MSSTTAIATTLDDPIIAGGVLGEEHITVLLVGIAMRLNRGAATYYRNVWDLGMTEWRLLLVLNRTTSLNVGELSVAADLDKAAVSRSLAMLEERKLVQIEQTRTRGRAAIAKLSAEGTKLSAQLQRASRERHTRLFKSFSKAEQTQLRGLLARLSGAMDGADWAS